MLDPGAYLPQKGFILYCNSSGEIHTFRPKTKILAFSLQRPIGNQAVELFHQAQGLGEGHYHALIVLHVVPRQPPSTPVVGRVFFNSISLEP